MGYITSKYLILGFLLAVGGSSDFFTLGDCHVNAEYFDNEKETWVSVDSLPTDATCIRKFASVFFDNGYYVIGGENRYGTLFDRIYRLDKQSWEWSEVGHLNTARIEHDAIFIHKWCRNIQEN